MTLATAADETLVSILTVRVAFATTVPLRKRLLGDAQTLFFGFRVSRPLAGFVSTRSPFELPFCFCGSSRPCDGSCTFLSFRYLPFQKVVE
ncbi:hypothetical protein BDV38DRAFT_53314 [Aspergillus pseudotamarii]|uniref:Uncharacterized protein n=1 Tax=Aspergillus pseudotamarii TaxID=132259 RepID=A0A5N6SAJ8_ASPPS|nr:uncharacterized protein BDV38DRAFT_53314 [Aspergillus pseudotamarii]KAE8130681.1 hypothetical protein BDV38DRAFT_53314 [Aspergillus pseudotamarii]